MSRRDIAFFLLLMAAAALYPRAAAAQSAGKLQVGEPAPAFEVQSLEDSTDTYRREELLGTTYLIDFWATWCAPCIAEMPILHEAYEKYRDRGFTILSMSFDAEPINVTLWRGTNEWTMPWLNGFVEGGFDSSVADSFGIVALPRPILIGPDGTILALEGDLRGEDLLRTLSRVFEGVADQSSAPGSKGH